MCRISYKIIGKGKLRRVTIILWLLLVVFYPLYSQFTSINGELRYQHQFQEATTYYGFYHKSIRKNPQFIIGTSGYLVSPSLFSVNLRTSINANYTTTTFGSASLSSKQYLFNFYDVNIDALQRYFVKVNFSARDNEVESISEYNRFSSGLISYRQQQQRLNLSTNNIKFLPSTSVYLTRTRNWSSSPLSTFNQYQHDLTVNLSQSAQDANISMTGTISDNKETTTGTHFQYYRVQMNGSKEFSSTQRVDVTGEYYKYENISMLSINGSYNGSVSGKFRLLTNIMGRNLYSATTSSIIAGLGQTVQYLQNENFNYTLGFQNQFGTDVYITDGMANKNNFNSYGGSGGIQHMRTISGMGISNGLSFGYSRQVSILEQSSSSASINNSVQALLAGCHVSATQGLSVVRTSGNYARDEINNIATLMVTGALPYNINSQTSIDFRNDRRFHTSEFTHRMQTLNFRQMFSTSLYYYIPLTIAAGGTLNWIWSGVTGRTYGINLNLSSSNFFIQNLSMSYRLNRSYDIYYRRPNLDQAAEFTYQWRALSFQLRYHEFRFTEVRREIWFVVTRPFNIGL